MLDQLKAFGEASFAARQSGRQIIDSRFTWDGFFGPTSQALRVNSPLAIGEIYAAAETDDFARFGGYALISECDALTTDPRYLELLDASLQKMFRSGLSSGHLNRYEADRWIATHGDLRTSFDRIVDVMPAPAGHLASVTLRSGEALMVATMGPDPLDNQFWIEHTLGGAYEVFSMRQWNSEAATLTRSTEETVGSWETPEAALQSLGQYLRRRPFWAHDELFPYFTERRDVQTMGLFSRRRRSTSGGIIPAQELERLPAVGWAVYHEGEHVDVSGFYLSGFLADGPPTSGTPEFLAFELALLDELVAGANSAGRWAFPGALYVAKDFSGADGMSHTQFVALVDKALPFMASVGVPGSFIPMFLLDRWAAVKAERWQDF